MLDKEDIKRIIRSAGYSPRFRDTVSRKGNGVGHTYVYAIKGNPGRSLGDLNDLQRMTEDELRKHIASRFAPPPVTEVISGKQAFMEILMKGKE